MLEVLGLGKGMHSLSALVVLNCVVINLLTDISFNTLPSAMFKKVFNGKSHIQYT